MKGLGHFPGIATTMCGVSSLVDRIVPHSQPSHLHGAQPISEHANNARAMRARVGTAGNPIYRFHCRPAGTRFARVAIEFSRPHRIHGITGRMLWGCTPTCGSLSARLVVSKPFSSYSVPFS
jgi:hypothetical protein